MRTNHGAKQFHYHDALAVEVVLAACPGTFQIRGDAFLPNRGQGRPHGAGSGLTGAARC